MADEKADDTPDWAYNEDGCCVCCGNGQWKYHMPECELRDALDLVQVEKGKEMSLRDYHG